MTETPDAAKRDPTGIPLGNEFLMRFYLQQMARAYRALSRYAHAICVATSSEWHQYDELDDQFWHFFQACWHIKDWLKNDSTVDAAVRAKAVAMAETAHDLRVAADLANGSKHLVLHSSRTGADDAAMVLVDCPDGSTGMIHVIRLGDNSTINGLEQARRCMAVWEEILRGNGLDWIVPMSR